MSLFIVQRYCAKNDNNGNPRRVYVIRDEHGAVMATIDEGYAGDRPIADWLFRRNVSGFDHRSTGDWHHAPAVVDIGDVDVSPGVYKRMIRYATN
jgi:hypothetical protein